MQILLKKYKSIVHEIVRLLLDINSEGRTSQPCFILYQYSFIKSLELLDASNII